MLSLFLLLSFGLILIGTVFVLFGSITMNSTGGCFLWPFPIIVVCGAGSGGAPFGYFIIGVVAVVLVFIVSLFWVRWRTGYSSNVGTGSDDYQSHAP